MENDNDKFGMYLGEEMRFPSNDGEAVLKKFDVCKINLDGFDDPCSAIVRLWFYLKGRRFSLVYRNFDELCENWISL